MIFSTCRQSLCLAGAIALGMLAPIRGAATEPDRPPDLPLVKETTIPLAGVTGRIDHLAMDPGRNRLLVAELGNGSVDVIDLATGTILHRIAGLPEPQGVAYVPGSDRIVVAHAGDGTVRFFQAGDGAPAGVVALGKDADNLRLDPRTGHVIVGYGSGGLAILDPSTLSRLGEIRLAGHPEGFQLAPAADRVFVNVPEARQIAVVDLAAGRQVATWTVPGLRANFPLAIDAAGLTLATVFRHPARLVLLDAASGAVTASVDTCGDADDVFFDDRRGRLYVSCGEGAVDVFGRKPDGVRHLGRIPTASGARTSLFAADRDRLFVAERAGRFGADAAILVFRPAP